MSSTAARWPRQRRPLSGGWRFDRVEGVETLISPEGDRYAPLDLLGPREVAEMRGIGHATLTAYLNREQSSAGTGWLPVGRRGWAIHAQAAVEP